MDRDDRSEHLLALCRGHRATVRPGADRPARRIWLLAIAGLVAALWCAAVSASAGAQQIDPTNAGYRSLHDRWDAHERAYTIAGSTTTDSRLNALMLQMHVQAAIDARPSILVDPQRVNALVDLLTRYPAFVDGKYTPYTNHMHSMAHVPGFTDSAWDKPGFQHVSVDPVIAMALALAYRHAATDGLRPDLQARARRAVLRVAAHPIFAPNQIRLGQLVWTADMIWAKYLVDGDAHAFVTAYRKALDYERALLPLLLSPYSSYRYAVYSNGTPAGVADKMDTPEYSFITFQGAAYIGEAKRLGMKMRPGEEQLYRRWANRLVWGEYGDDGYLNWDTGLGQHRRHITQYWAWTTLSLQRIASMTEGGVLPQTTLDRAAALCNRAQQFFADRVADNNGVLPFTMFHTWNDFLQDTAPAMGEARLLLALQTCPDGSKLANARSYDPENHRFAVTTSAYTTSVTPYARDAISGFLPSKLQDADGEPIGGLGGRHDGFDLVVGGLGLNDTFRQNDTWTMHAAGGSGPLGARNRTYQARVTGGSGDRTQHAVVRGRFTDDRIDLAVQLSRSAQGYWRIPVPPGAFAVRRVGGDTVLRMTPAHGAPWDVTVPGAPAVHMVAVARDRLDPTIRRTAHVAVRGPDLRATIHVGQPVRAARGDGASS